jgi:hypothetical protein
MPETACEISVSINDKGQMLAEKGKEEKICG